jgi:predicted membrane-bound spermidine synthase
MTSYSLKRDYAATVVAYERDHNKGLFINGIGTAYLTPLTKVMAHLPLLLCPHPPCSGLVICFGMGTSFRSLASWDIDTTAVELVPSVKEDFSFGFPDAPRVLARPNVRIVIDDGRRFLLRTRKKYDVITLDPQPPVEAAGSSLLYSEDFYQELQDRLAEGGVVQQWIPDGDPVIQKAFIRSFVNAFPHVLALHSYEEWGTHLIGSMAPLTVPGIPELVKRMPGNARKDLMEWRKTGNLRDFLRLILSQQVDVKTLLDPDEKIVVTDDRPLNEYYFLRQTFPTLFKY